MWEIMEVLLRAACIKECTGNRMQMNTYCISFCVDCLLRGPNLKALATKADQNSASANYDCQNCDLPGVPF